MIPAAAALERLRAGNQRFVEGNLNSESLASPARRNALTSDQKPFAVILGCSDSRVPGEMVFDQGLGDLFVVRVAGNIVAPSQIGSIEFAAVKFGCRLVVVLGHSNCGAVSATLDYLKESGETLSESLQVIVDRIGPSVEELLNSDPGGDHDALLEAAVEANIHASVKQLRQESDILGQMVESGDLLIIGAEYSLSTGKVKFLDQST